MNIENECWRKLVENRMISVMETDKWGYSVRDLENERDNIAGFLEKSTFIKAKTKIKHPFNTSEHWDNWLFADDDSHYLFRRATYRRRDFNRGNYVWKDEIEGIRVTHSLEDFADIFFSGNVFLSELLDEFKSHLLMMESSLLQISYEHPLVSTNIFDKNGKEIFIGQSLYYKNQKFLVEMDDFFNKPMITNKERRCPLVLVHDDCEVA